MPAIAPATPERELSREMVMGISAPPTRMVNRIPKPRDTTAISSPCRTGEPIPTLSRARLTSISPVVSHRDEIMVVDMKRSLA